MAWTDPSAHTYTTGENVTAATLNTYVQQDLISLGAYTSGSRYFLQNQGPLTSTVEAALGNAANINTFPEAYTMVVKVLGRMGNPTAGNHVSLYLRDQANSAFIDLFGQAYLLTAPTGSWVGVALIGKKQYAANASAGFFLNYSVDASNANFQLGIEVSFVRGAV